MNIIFFGSDDFAAYHLEKLIATGHKIPAVVTRPDKARGRHLKVSGLPVKETARRHAIEVLQPEDVKDEGFLRSLRNFTADLFVVIAYGKILPGDVLKIPRLFSVNVHASLLPKYRGASPIHWAIVNGDRSTGVTIIKINARMDAGEMVAQDEISIDPDDTTPTLKQKLSEAGAALLIKTLPLIEKGACAMTPQDEQKATYVAKLTKDLGKIDWSKSADDIHNLVRGLVPWPGAYTFWNGKMLKILKSKIVEGEKGGEKIFPGKIVQINRDGLDVSTGRGVLRIVQLHPESAKPMDACSFAMGRRIVSGMSLG